MLMMMIMMIRKKKEKKKDEEEREENGTRRAFASSPKRLASKPFHAQQKQGPYSSCLHLLAIPCRRCNCLPAPPFTWRTLGGRGRGGGWAIDLDFFQINR